MKRSLKTLKKKYNQSNRISHQDSENMFNLKKAKKKMKKYNNNSRIIVMMIQTNKIKVKPIKMSTKKMDKNQLKIWCIQSKEIY